MGDPDVISSSMEQNMIWVSVGLLPLDLIATLRF